MKKYICIHGHFYQPPRENAWLEKIEYQDSAAPYHDWNERITQECYGPNSVSRILVDDRRIVDIVNNYSSMSFNFGPTLLSWLETHRPKTYSRIIDADRLSMERFGGHGSAMAQVYNHLIMPLANRRDKETQVIWGLRDFEKRFGRKAEGMWLAETAVDTETLEVLAEQGLKFTVLAPRQAKQYRKIGEEEWTMGIDPRMPYKCHLPSGKSINLFFYDGDRSEAVAFKNLLSDGKRFAEYLASGFDNREGNQLVHIATDGESYGHHHRYGDMALAYCIRYIESNNLATITNYSQYLTLSPPEYEVEIHENSSWSCVHGIERWRSNCGCNSGRAGWQQEWREPLRNALDWLRDRINEIYEESMLPYNSDPWGLRNQYIDIILDRTPERVEEFLDNNFPKIVAREKTHLMRMMEMQRHALLMYTSCGWFFDEISGIETIQILQYAARAIQLAEGESDYELEEHFETMLESAPSNIPTLGNGKQVYIENVKPSKLTLTQIGMHYAVSSLFAEDPDDISIFNYACKAIDFRRIVHGTHRLAFGRTHVNSRVTLSEKNFSFVIIYIGQHHLVGIAFERISDLAFEAFTTQVTEAFQASNLSMIFDLFKKYPDRRSFSFFDMFKDEQIKMLNGLVHQNLNLAAASYREINNRNYNLLNVMKGSHLQLPNMLVHNLEMVLNFELRQLFTNCMDRIDVYELKRVIEEIKKWEFKMDHTELNYICAGTIDKLLLQLGTLTNGNAHRAGETLKNVREALTLLGKVGIKPDLNEIQDIVFSHLIHLDPDIPNDVQEHLKSFAEYINLDVGVILNREKPALV